MNTGWPVHRWLAAAAVLGLFALGPARAGCAQAVALSSGDDPQVAIGPADVPALKVLRREGRVLELDCRALRVLKHEDGTTRRGDPPKFTAYRNSREVGSGTFEYG